MITGVLKSVIWNLSLKIVSRNLALNCGSSKHGKAVRAYVVSNCVAAKFLKASHTFFLYKTKLDCPKKCGLKNSWTMYIPEDVHYFCPDFFVDHTNGYSNHQVTLLCDFFKFTEAPAQLFNGT